MIPPLFENQEETVALGQTTPIIFDMSDPGTGKTRAHLELFIRRLRAGGGKCIVFAPKSILQAAWGDDIDTFFPGIYYSCAYATNREEAFLEKADIYITNHDAVKWIMHKNCPLPKDYWDDFDTLIVDESGAFKHHTSQRSKAMLKFSKMFKNRAALNGVPNPNSVTELWHQTLILDEGERFGTSYWRFRPQVQAPESTGPGGRFTVWSDREGSEEAMFDMLRDISIRHPLEGLPENRTYPVYFELPRKLRIQYNDMLHQSVLLADSGEAVTAIHAASVNQKLLQIAAGGIYTGVDKEWLDLDGTRTELIMDLLDAREASVVVIAWQWQRQYIAAACKKRGYPYAVIDGSVTSAHKRTESVRDFQAGKLKSLIIHPASAGHGLTLTRGKTTILASPTYNAEHYKQVFHRIFRKGQDSITETIHIIARDTIDQPVYDKLGGKLTAMELFTSLVQSNVETQLES